MSFKRIINNEYVYSTITRFVTIAIGIIQSMIIARYLGAELKGINAYISSIASIGSIIITFGMHQAYPYFRKIRGKDSIFQDYISLISAMYAVFFTIGILLSFFMPLEVKDKIVFALIPLLGYSRIIDYVLLIEKPNTRNTWWVVISLLDILYVIVLWVFVKRSITWGISILLFSDIIKCIAYSIVLRISIRLHKGLFGLLKELIQYGFFPMLALLMTTLNYRIDVLMLHQYSHISNAMIGIYSLGISLSDKTVMIPDTLKGVMVSKLAKGASDEEVAKVSRIGLWSSVLLFFFIALLGKWIISTFYGEEYIDAYTIILITAFGLLFVVYFKFISQYNIINKRQKVNVALLSIAIVIDVVLNAIFIPVWGINGAALSTSIGNCVCGIAFILYFCKKTKIPITKMIIPQKSDVKTIKSMLYRES